VARIREQVAESCAAAGDRAWALRVSDAIAVLLKLLAAEPALASIVLVEGLRAGRGVYDRYQGVIEAFVTLLREGAPASPAGGEVPAATDEAVVGGVASMMGRRVLAGEAEKLGQLFPEILEFVLAAYLGVEEARRIVSAR
jgi:hypothetical protein